MTVYTLVCVRADGVRTTMEVAPAGDQAEARHLALQMLERHTSCNQVEVWDEDGLQFTIHGSRGHSSVDEA